jgi:hypothetical protein
VIFPLDVHNWPNKLNQKSIDEKLSLSRVVELIVIHKPQNGASSIAELNSRPTSAIMQHLQCMMIVNQSSFLVTILRMSLAQADAIMYCSIVYIYWMIF